jgi:glucose/arabinose dehydrogenase
MMVRRLFGWAFFAIAGLFLILVVGASSCGYIALPGGLIINFSNLPGSEVEPMAEDDLQSRLQLPEGFTIETWANGIPNARMLLATPADDVLVSAPREGKIFLIRGDADGDRRHDGVEVLIEGLDRPHGIAWHQGNLYIAEGSAVARVPFDPETREVGTPERIVEGLPEGGNHWTRTVHVGPDEKLYVSIGSSCNVCEEEDPRRAAIVRYELDGSGEKIFATGLRNAVDFAWRPETGDLYSTGNGRDLLGDDYPPEEINLVVEDGFYGWPYANPPRRPDPDFGALRPDKVAASIPPAYGLPAHTAPLGIVFYEGDSFPERYHGSAFVALHGSWNRRKKQGYEVVTLFFQEDGSIEHQPFLTGFEVDEDVSGRPVGLAVGADGALFVSDDYTGSVYRVAYGEAPAVRSGNAAARVATRDPLEGLSPARVATARQEGARLWEQNDCASCHIQGAGKAPAHILQSLGQKFSVSSMEKFLQAPQPPMPLYPFSEAERSNLSIFLLDRFD